MSENQFSIGLKISAVVAVILLIGIIVIAVNTVKTKNTTASVLEDVPNANIVLTNEEEVEENIWEN
jgi:FlaG/FlaF family flagellin (archaellin)